MNCTEIITEQIKRVNMLKRNLIIRPILEEIEDKIKYSEYLIFSDYRVIDAAPTIKETKANLLRIFQNSPWHTIKYHAATGLDLSRDTLEQIVWSFVKDLKTQIEENECDSDEHDRLAHDLYLLRRSTEENITGDAIEELRKYSPPIMMMLEQNPSESYQKTIDEMWQQFKFIKYFGIEERLKKELVPKKIIGDFFCPKEKHYDWNPADISSLISFSDAMNSPSITSSEKYRVILFNNLLKSRDLNELSKELIDVSYLYAIVDISNQKIYALTLGDELKNERPYCKIAQAEINNEGICVYALEDPYPPRTEIGSISLMIADYKNQQKYVLPVGYYEEFAKIELGDIIKAELVDDDGFSRELRFDLNKKEAL